ncbi:MAG: hypothetical protein D6695_10610, partial [Planctomycetota bacterium]
MSLTTDPLRAAGRLWAGWHPPTPRSRARVADIRPGTLRLHDRHSSYDVSMTRRVFRLYQRHKLININVNVAAAGLLAILVAKYPVLVMDG